MDEIPELASGTIIGRHWKIQRTLGKGACGIVYEVTTETASLLSMLDRSISYVAKCIPYGHGLTAKKKKDQERVSNTLNKEMNLLAPGKLLTYFKFRPKIPSMHYHGRDELNHVNFLILEKLDGGDLIAWSKKRPVPTVQEIAGIGLQILEGLEWLHSKGWLFIDIKPDNFMFRGDQIVFIDCKILTFLLVVLFSIVTIFNTYNICMHVCIIIFRINGLLC